MGQNFLDTQYLILLLNTLVRSLLLLLPVEEFEPLVVKEVSILYSERI